LRLPRAKSSGMPSNQRYDAGDLLEYQ